MSEELRARILAVLHECAAIRIGDFEPRWYVCPVCGHRHSEVRSWNTREHTEDCDLNALLIELGGPQTA